MSGLSPCVPHPQAFSRALFLLAQVAVVVSSPCMHSLPHRTSLRHSSGRQPFNPSAHVLTVLLTTTPRPPAPPWLLISCVGKPVASLRSNSRRAILVTVKTLNSSQALTSCATLPPLLFLKYARCAPIAGGFLLLVLCV